ncbi:MAG: pentapeptide repeat-containing protein [Planctomycetota bacterium]
MIAYGHSTENLLCYSTKPTIAEQSHPPEHAIERFSNGGLTHACPVMASVTRQMATSKRELKQRWKNDDFVAALTLPKNDIPQQTQLQNVDLRGVPKLGLDDPLGWFKFHEVESHGIDFSFGDGALIAHNSTIADLICHEFKFDRASAFCKSTFLRADFARSRLRLNAIDCEFIEYIFDASTFAGGLNEYGFRRCSFRDCTFSSANWQRTYLRACQFTGCKFADMIIADSIIAGFKYELCAGFRDEMFVKCDVGGVVNVA